MVDRDQAALEEMERFGRECLDLVADMDRDEFVSNRVLRLAVERLLEIIGEAAGRVSEPIQARLDVDWKGLRGLRNVLAHRYGAVEPARVWAVLATHLRPLVALLEGRRKKGR